MLDPVVSRHLALEAAVRKALPGDAVPFVATMRLRRDGRERDILLGDRAHIGDGITRIDHARAPLAAIFHGTEPGDAYAIDVDGRPVEGTLIERSLVRFEDGALTEIITAGRRHWRRGNRWSIEPAPTPPSFDGPRRAGHFVDIDRLDPAQRRAVDAPRGPSLVVGEAGSGKTTVALWRLARLLDRLGPSGRARVIVPTPALARFAARQLDRLGRPDVRVTPFAEWAWREARRAFPDWPKRRCRDGAAVIDDLKRHPHLLPELSDLAQRLPPRPVRRADLVHVFGDSVRLNRVSAYLPAGSAPATLAHARVQYADPAEVEWAHVDPARLATLDARFIDDGTPMQDAGAADVSDVAVAFELERLAAARTGRCPRGPRQHDVLLIDEAQAFAPIELRLLGRAIAPGGSLTVSGDAGQHMGPAGSFGGWRATQAALGIPDAPRFTLPTVYRSPPALAAWSRRWVEPGPPTPIPAEVVTYRAWHACHLMRWAVDIIEGWSVGSLAVITRSDENARRWAEMLDRTVPVRFDPMGSPPDGGGVAVLPAQHVRGLEFDGVIIPDAGPSWTTARADRRALYIAATRATARLMLGTVGRFSPLLAPDRGRSGEGLSSPR